MLKRVTVGLAVIVAVSGVGCNALLGIEPLSDADGDAGAGGSTGGTGTVGQPCGREGALACAGHAQRVQLACQGGKWQTAGSCPAGQACDTRRGNEGLCETVVAGCAGKLPGEQYCDGRDVVTCGPDLVSSERETCANACVNDACSGACEDGTRRCNGVTVQRCDAQGLWQTETTCSGACLNGTCVDCLPDTKQCSGQVPQTCAANGAWQSSAACPNACVGGVCTGECAVGTVQCSGSSLQRCDAEGRWTTQAVCSGACLSGACVDCMPSVRRCEGQVPQTCSQQGQWESGDACQYVCMGGSCVGSCSPDSKQCSDNTPQTCTAQGAWQSGAACQYVCSGGTCTGSCAPGSRRCEGATPQRCSAQGEWQDAPACGAGAECSEGHCALAAAVPPASCAVSGAGRTDCGSGSESCCTSLVVPGGSFMMGRSTVAGGSDEFSSGNDNELPEHSTTVASFALDKYEVTVGRFRQFVEQYTGVAPAVGAGAHPLVSGSGWQAEWGAQLPPSLAVLSSSLQCSGSYPTWTPQAGANERKPINCVNWYEAFAFCVWDGGRLPTEAEWESAAAGGADNRLYPWGSTPPGPNTTLAVYGCFRGGGGICSGVSNIAHVGSARAGDGRWGQTDLAGNVFEWVLDAYASDWYSGAGIACSNCANVDWAIQDRSLRGGDFSYLASALRAASRSQNPASYRTAFYGLRCARSL